MARCFFSILLLVIFSSPNALSRKNESCSKIPGTYNVLDYGAVNDGLADCSPAFGKLIKSIEGRQVDIYLPAGKYRITERIVIDMEALSGYNENVGIHFHGAGEDVTELICDNPDGGVFFNIGTNLITVSVSNMSFVSNRDGGGTAIEFNTKDQNPGDHHSRMFQASDVLIRGPRFNKGFFNSGVIIKNAWYPMLDNVKITSVYGKAYGKMEYGFLIKDCYSPLVDKCYFWGPARYGLLYTKENAEDGIISNSYFVGQDIGVSVDLSPKRNGWGEPAFHLTNTHIHYKVKGLELKGVRQGFVSNNLFYCATRNGSKWWNKGDKVSEITPKDIECTGVNDFIISNNQFTEPATPKRICIDILPDSGNLLINANIFNMDGTAIRNQSVQYSRCIGNVYDGIPKFTYSGGENKVRVIRNYDDPNGTLKIFDLQ